MSDVAARLLPHVPSSVVVTCATVAGVDRVRELVRWTTRPFPLPVDVYRSLGRLPADVAANVATFCTTSETVRAAAEDRRATVVDAVCANPHAPSDLLVALIEGELASTSPRLVRLRAATANLARRGGLAALTPEHRAEAFTFGDTNGAVTGLLDGASPADLLVCAGSLSWEDIARHTHRFTDADPVALATLVAASRPPSRYPASTSALYGRLSELLEPAAEADLPAAVLHPLLRFGAVMPRLQALLWFGNDTGRFSEPWDGELRLRSEHLWCTLDTLGALADVADRSGRKVPLGPVNTVELCRLSRTARRELLPVAELIARAFTPGPAFDPSASAGAADAAAADGSVAAQLTPQDVAVIVGAADPTVRAARLAGPVGYVEASLAVASTVLASAADVETVVSWPELPTERRRTFTQMAAAAGHVSFADAGPSTLVTLLQLTDVHQTLVTVDDDDLFVGLSADRARQVATAAIGTLSASRLRSAPYSRLFATVAAADPSFVTSVPSPVVADWLHEGVFDHDPALRDDLLRRHVTAGGDVQWLAVTAASVLDDLTSLGEEPPAWVDAVIGTVPAAAFTAPEHLAAALTRLIGDDPAVWETVLRVAGSWDGTIPDLVAAARHL